MFEREWWPAEWADEVMPPSRPSPDAWIVDADGHYWLGYAFDAPDANAQEKRLFNRALTSDEPIEFFFSDALGDIEITVFKNGGWQGPAPATGANWFWWSFTGLCGDTIDEVAQQIAEAEDIPAADGLPVTLSAARHGSQRFKLQLDYSAGAQGPRPYFTQAEAVS